jgi:hypothetical protein
VFWRLVRARPGETVRPQDIVAISELLRMTLDPWEVLAIMDMGLVAATPPAPPAPELTMDVFDAIVRGKK